MVSLHITQPAGLLLSLLILSCREDCRVLITGRDILDCCGALGACDIPAGLEELAEQNLLTFYAQIPDVYEVKLLCADANDDGFKADYQDGLVTHFGVVHPMRPER
jgi:hypothetical protein